MEINKRDRTQLKSYFVKNAIPTEQQFADFIDAVLNQKDDGIVKLPGDPLTIAAEGDDTSQKKVLNFYMNLSDEKPSWTISLNPRTDPNNADTARLGFSVNDGDGASRLFIDRDTGRVGIGTTNPNAKLEVKGGAMMPSAGNSATAGIMFPKDPGGGGGDAAWIRYYARSGEATTFEIGTANDRNDHVALMASGNIGVGTTNPNHKFHVVANQAVGLFESTGTHAFLRFTTKEGLDNRVEIANRPGGRLALWTAQGGDVLNITRDGKTGIKTTNPVHPLHVNGEVFARDGLLVAGNRSTHIETDGALYRYKGQVYITVDDNLYIRDRAGGIKFHFDTNSGWIRQPGWTTLPLVNGWVNYGGGYNPGAYFKDSMGMVHLRGLIKNGNKKAIATLPAGYRPSRRCLHAATTHPNANGRVDIHANGVIEAIKYDKRWISLDGITFRTA